MADYQIRGRMNLETGQFIGALNGAESALKKFQNSNDNANKKVAGFGRILRTVATGALAAYVVKLGVDSVKAAQAAGAAQDRLRRLLLNTGGATEAQIGLLNQQAQALEALTVVSDDNITTVQSQLATFDLAAKEIATLTPAILDYVVAERGAGASTDEFRSLTNGLAQALNGNFASLTRVGFVLDEATKKTIKSGTESERARAIVDVLNTTYKDFAKTAGGTAAGAQIKLRNEIDNVKEAFGNALLPTIQKVQGFVATNLIPIFQNLQERFADGTSVQRFVDFIGMLGKNIIDFGTAIIQIIGPVFTSVFLPVIKLAIGAVIAFIKVIGAIGRFIQRNIKVFQILAGVITAVAIGIGAYIIQVKLFNAVSKVMLFLTGAKTLATKKLTTAFKALNFVMKANPIGFLIGAVAALVTGFIMLWNRSEAFRKIVIAVGKFGLKALASLIRGIAPFAEAVLKGMTLPIRGFLKIMSYIPGVGKHFKTALNVANKALDGTSEFLTGAADKLDVLADGLDKYAKKKVKAPKVEKPKIPKMPDFSFLPDSDKLLDDPKAKKAAKAAAERLAELQQNLKEAVQNYNDFMNTDFKQSFMKGAEAARDGIMSGLDKLKAVFDAQGKMLEGTQLENLRKIYDAVNAKVRGMVDGYMEVAQQIEDVGEEIKQAQGKLEDALKARAEGANALTELLRRPFGEPSAIQQALDGATATVNSIISTYDSLVDAINKRFEGIDPTKRDVLVDILTTQTAQLVSLAKQREVVAEDLAKAQRALEDALTARRAGAGKIREALASPFGSPSDLSKAFASAEATSDSIIGMFEKLRDSIMERYEGFDPTGRDNLIRFLEGQTTKLLELAKKRSRAAEALEKTQEDLKRIIEEQADFANSLTKSLRDFGNAIADLSDTDSKATTRVIKTATGLVITQMRESTSGVDKITKQMSERLKAIQEFSRNAQTLLARGLNAEYVRQLLMAGPETAGQTLAVLASASEGQITQINSLYSSIETASTQFGSTMSELFYGNAIDMAEAFVKGAQAEYDMINQEMTNITNVIMDALWPLQDESTVLGMDMALNLVEATEAKLKAIDEQMTLIRKGIEIAMAPLADVGTNVGEDFMVGMLNALEKRRVELISKAQEIAKAVAEAMSAAAVAAGIGGIEIPQFDPIAPTQTIEATKIVSEDYDEKLRSLAKVGLGAAAAARLAVPAKPARVPTGTQSSGTNLGNRPLGSTTKTGTSTSGTVNASVIINTQEAPSPSWVSSYLRKTLTTATNKRKG